MEGARYGVKKTVSAFCLLGGIAAACLSNTSAYADQTHEERAEIETLDGKQLIQKTLNDESLVQAKPRRMSLEECIKLGIKNNYQIQANKKLVEQSEWNLIASRREWYPSVSLSSAIYGGYTSFQESLIQSDGVTSTFLTSGQSYNAYEQFSPGVGVTWYFANPTVIPAINSSLALVKAQRFTYDYIVRGIILDVQTAYINVQGSQQLVEAYKKIYESNKEQVNYLEAQLKKGMVDIGAVAQSKTTMYQQLASLVTFQQTLAQQGNQLAQLIGYKDSTIVLATETLKRDKEWKPDLGESIKRGLEAREEIKEYLETADSYRWQARELINSYLPSLYITYSGSISEIQGCLNVDSKNNCPSTPSTNNTWSNSVSLGVSWNFDGGQNMANANANKKAAEANIDYAKNEETLVAQQIKDSFSQYKAYDVAIGLAERQLASAKLNSDVSAERFRVGIGDITTVVQAQQLLSSAVQAEVQALQQFNLAIAQLNRYSAILPNGVSQDILMGEDNE